MATSWGGWSSVDESAARVISVLNQSQGGMCICQASAVWIGVLQKRFRSGLQDCPAPPSHLCFAVSQSCQEQADPFLHRRLAPQTQVARGFFPGPSPDGPVSVEVWAVPWQIQQLQSQPWPPQVFPHRLPAVGWGIVPDHLQEPRISGLCMTTFCMLLTFLW